METEKILHKIIYSLKEVEGVKAIALGGSQSRGEADEHSDYDVGIYYNDEDLDLEMLNKKLKELDDDHRDSLLNAPGQWGPWINGGAWLKVDDKPVDILLRDIRKVEEIVKDCIEGIVTIDYQCGHPFGFVNTIYAAETHYCKILWQDETMPLEKLKTILYSKGEYSPTMREATIKKFLWEARFSLDCGRKPGSKGDINYVVGSVFRTVCSWMQVLYALNKQYLMNEKGALKWVGALNRNPAEMENRVREVYKLLADGDAERAYQILETLHLEIEVLSSGIEKVVTIIR